MSNLKALVTGADGFIGSHLVEALVRQGWSVKAFVYYNSFDSRGWLDQSPPEILDAIEVFAGDIRDPHGVHEAAQGCDVIFHLASLIAIPYSYHSPSSYIETNVTGTLNVVQAARALGISKVVHTSTSEVYGTAQFVPITEDHPQKGQSPYSASKIGADQIAMSYHLSFDTPVAIIRPFNTYGPRQSARAIIPTVITQLLSGKDALRLGTIHPTRDFSFVDDTVSGFIAVAQSDRSTGEIINIGSGFEISIKDTVNIIAEAIGVKPDIETEDVRIRPAASEVERLFASISKAEELLGWQPTHGGTDGFRRGIAKTVDWFRNPENLKQYTSDRYVI